MGVKTCGTHIVDKKAIECDVNAIETQFNADLAAIDKQLNPAAFVEVKRPKRLFAKKPFRSGGWGDPRDLKLCLDMIHNDYVNLTLIRSMTWIYFLSCLTSTTKFRNFFLKLFRINVT